VSEHRPDLLVSLIITNSCRYSTANSAQFCASMWTLEESERIQSIALGIIPELQMLVLSQGLLVEKGPEAVVEYVQEHLDAVILGH
jgi:hypothetical protein